MLPRDIDEAVPGKGRGQKKASLVAFCLCFYIGSVNIVETLPRKTLLTEKLHQIQPQG